MSSVMDPGQAPRREDIVSWIGEFSYIFTSGLFDMDDIGLFEDSDCHSLQESPEVQVVVRDVKSNNIICCI
jgi:hypothetical protein